MIKKIKKALGLGEPNPREGVSLVINAEKLERRVALLEDGVLEEFEIEREGDDNIVGSIFKGRIKNIEQGLKAMFVDIGMEKNAFLHFWDAIPAALDNGLEEIHRQGRSKKKGRPNKITSRDIPNIMRTACLRNINERLLVFSTQKDKVTRMIQEIIL